MEEKQKYACSFCGTEYDNAPARARCELECDEKRKQEDERRRKEELLKNRNKRLSDIREKYKDLDQAVRAYGKDYDLDDLLPIMRTSKLGTSPYWLLWA